MPNETTRHARSAASSDTGSLIRRRNILRRHSEGICEFKFDPLTGVACGAAAVKLSALCHLAIRGSGAGGPHSILGERFSSCTVRSSVHLPGAQCSLK